MKNINSIQHKRSNDVINGLAVVPSPSVLEYGELAINYRSGSESLFTKNDDDEVVNLLELGDKVGNVEEYWKNVEDSGITYDKVIGMLNYNVDYIKQWVGENFERKPYVVWESDGKSGLLGVNDNTMSLTSWQLEGLDFSPFKYVIAYIKQADRDFSSLQTNYVTPSMMVCIPLDSASLSTGYTAYIGGANSTNPNDRNVNFCVLCAIDETKSKFKVVSEHSIYGTALGGRNDNGRYCYKIEGHY